MGRWLVILSLAVIAMSLPHSLDGSPWKTLLSSFTSAPRPTHSDEAQPFGAAVTADSGETIIGSQAPEPPSSQEPDAGLQAREPLNSPEPVSGWQVSKPLSFPEPITGPQFRMPPKLNL